MGFWQDITGVTAANTAAEAQLEMSQQGIDEQRRQFEIAQGNMAPYMQAGVGALEQQQALSGALGPQAQQQAYDMVQNSPGFQSALQQGETSILQNAAATGGVRGGNTQGALAQYSPTLLGQAIDQRYGQLGGLAGMGQASAAGISSAGMNMGQNISNNMNQMGQTQAANALGNYNLQSNFLGDIAGFGLNLAGLFV
jgi:hypothetical protein